MASGISGVGSAIGGVVQDIGEFVGAGYTEAGEEAAAEGFSQAATIAWQNSEEAGAAGKLQQIQEARKLYQVAGSGVAATAGNGLKLQGSAASILANSQAQGAVAQQLIGTQTQINVNSYLAQMRADYSEEQQADQAAAAAKASKTFDLLGAGVSGISAVAQIAAMAG